MKFLVTGLSVLALATPPQAAPLPPLTDLGTLGGTSSNAQGINDTGQVAGWSYTPGNASYHAFIWDSGGMRDLSTLGGISSYAQAINSIGQVAGLSYTAGNTTSHAFVWHAGEMRDLGTLGGTYSDAHAINDAGQVVGLSYTAGNTAYHAFIWDAALGMRDLGTLGGTYSYAYGINNVGQVVGWAYTAGNAASHAFVWDGTRGMRDLGTLGGTSSTAYGINEAGQVVGGSAMAGNTTSHAFIWDAALGMRDLGTLGGTHSNARAINGAGWVVGGSRIAGTTVFHAFVWNPTDGMRDLGTLGGSSSYAYDINEIGQVVGESGRAFRVALTINIPPLADAGVDQTEYEGSKMMLDGTASSDFNSDVLTYAWVQISGSPVLLSDAAAPQPIFVTPLVTAEGENLEFELTVNDGSNEFASDTVVVHVQNVNAKPLADAGAEQTVNEGETVTLSGTASDPDGEILTYTWVQIHGQAVALSDISPHQPNFTAPFVSSGGTDIMFELVVSDGSGGVTRDSVVIHVKNVSDPPLADAGTDQTVNENSVVTLHGTASGPEGEALTYAWTQIGGSQVTLSNATAQQPDFTAPFVSSGGADLIFELLVKDDSGDFATDTVVIHVQNVNEPPLVTAAQPSIAMLRPPNRRLVTVGIIGVTDPNGDNPTITITGITQDEPSSGLDTGDIPVDAFIQADGTVQLRAERSELGDGRVYRVAFTASDLEGSASAVVLVKVPLNLKKPAIDSGGNYDSTR